MKGDLQPLRRIREWLEKIFTTKSDTGCNAE